MSDLVALILDREARARVTAGTRGVARVVFCETVVEVHRAVESAWSGGTRVGAVIVEPRDSAGAPCDALIATLRRRAPAVPVLAYCSPTASGSADILAAARAGVSGLLLRGHDDVGIALRSALASAGDDCAARHIMRELGVVVPAGARPIVEHCVLHARSALTVSGIARALGVHRKTLVNRLAAARLPGPQTVVGWSRLLLVGHALEEPGLPVERIALDFDFPSATALRNMLKRYTGLRPAEVRENGGLSCVLHLAKRALAPYVEQRASSPVG